MDDITLNEKIHWDTILTKTKDLNKNITLYHVSDVKDPGNKVYPLHLTVGNKLEHSPYYASWWAEESEPGGAINDTQVKSLTERVEQIINNKFMDNLLESVDSVKTKQYSEYLITHISNVKKGYFWIKENCPEMLNKCNQKILENNIIAHDESKYSNEEYIPYMNFFYGEKTEAVKKAFNEAWEHHYLNNKHHPEWWHGTPMSEEAILEMICDWWSFSWKSGKLDEIFNYFKDNVENKSKNIHPETKQRVSELLDILHEALIRENLL